MLRKIITLAKGFATNLTFIRLLSNMNLLVLSKI